MVEAFWRRDGGHAPAIPMELPHPSLPAAGACCGGCSLARLLRSRSTCKMQCSKCFVQCCRVQLYAWLYWHLTRGGYQRCRWGCHTCPKPPTPLADASCGGCTRLLHTVSSIAEMLATI